MTLTKDEQYYFKDGTCTFQVGDHLFKIHQYLLMRGSSFFVKMFELPQKSTTGQDRTEVCKKGSERSSDDNPLICHDSVASFRTLCWGLYLRPFEVRKQEDPAHVDLSQLISLASIAHKYKFELLEKWAVATLREHWMNALPPSEEETELSWPLDTMMQLLALSLKTETMDQKFKATIESQWLSSSIDNIEDPADTKRVLDFVDGFSSQRVYGLTYYHVLRGFEVFPLPRASNSQDSDTGNPCPKLKLDAFHCPKNITGMMARVSHEQCSKLMHGFLRLISVRRASSLGQVQFECTCTIPLPVVPTYKPALPGLVSSHTGRRFVLIPSHTGHRSVTKPPHSSVSYVRCRSAWDTIWKSIGDTLDFGAMLEEALRRVKQGDTWGAPESTCKERLVAELQSLLASFEENLVDYFILS